VYPNNPRAYEQGFNDGYEAGLDDGEDGRRFDPIAESRYRSGDRGYEREYGTREAYKIDYRNAFRQGYEAGYNDGRRYGILLGDKNTLVPGSGFQVRGFWFGVR
jgi:flagellar biosynthesis/type III secretory pathway protein FliH